MKLSDGMLVIMWWVNTYGITGSDLFSTDIKWYINIVVIHFLVCGKKAFAFLAPGSVRSYGFICCLRDIIKS